MMPDYTIHTNPDARAWARYFCELNPGKMDEETMIGWFANAMMAMHDHLLGIKVLNGDHAQYLIEQESLGKDFDKVLHDHLDELLVKT